MSILFVHPEGTISSNPSLIAIAESLAEAGHKVYITSYEHPKSGSDSNFFILPIDRKRLYKFKLLAKTLRRVRLLPSICRWILQRYLGCCPSIIVGIDAEGIIIAKSFSDSLKLPYAFLSFEIFFSDEVGDAKKEKEISACKDIQFAICQGGIRSRMLARENNINIELIETMPVAPRPSRASMRPISLRSLFSIRQDKVAVVSGSISSWNCIEEILLSTHDWPKDWALLVHSRHGLDSRLIRRLKNLGNSNVYFSCESIDSISELYSLLGAADLAICCYRPIYTDPYVGDNIRHLGLSSGKIACFLKEGVPVVVNQIGEYADLLSTWDAGIVINYPLDISSILNTITLERLHTLGENARSLFREKINADLYVSRICERFNACHVDQRPH